MSRTGAAPTRLRSSAEALALVREAAGGASDRAARARAVADAIRAHGGHRWVGVYDVGETEVAVVAWSGGGPPAFPRFPRTAGLTGRAIEGAETVVVDDVAADPDYLEAFGDTRAEAIVPVVAGGAVVGTIDVESGMPNAFGENDRDFLERCAAAALPLWQRL